MSRQQGYPRALLAPALVGLAAAVLSLWLLPATASRLGPTTVELDGRVGLGRTTLQITPFGTLSARTHASPLDITAALHNVDIEDLAEQITTPQGREGLQEQIESQIPALLARTAVKEIVAALVVGAVIGAAVFRRRRRGALVAGASGCLAMVVLMSVTALTFEQDRFANAHYSGSLDRARQVIEAISEHTETLDEARTRYQVAATRAAQLMVLLADPDVQPGQDTTAILHISDVHANPIGLEIAQQLAREFDVAGVVDTGDLASSFLDTGELSSLAGPIDQLMVRGIEDLGVPYLFVPGNHDSPKLVDAVSGASNAQVLDATSVTVGDVEIFGWADPTYATTPIPEQEKSTTRATFSNEVAETVGEAAPDVFAVHDAVMASALPGLVPLVLSGHFHRRTVGETAGTRFLGVGSTGATGLKSLTVDADLRYEAEILYFEGGRLVAVDYVTLRGLGADFTLDRTTFPATEGL